MSDRLEDRLDTVYKTKGDRTALDDAYDDWARDYDQDLCASGNPYITLIVGLAGRYISDKGARILDGGCGTGQLGFALRCIGFGNIVGLDASDGMLAEARNKGCYTALHKLLLGAHFDLPDASFDAVTAAGVLTHGHAPVESLDGILRIAKPGAPIIFSMSEPAFNEGGFGAKSQDLEKAGKWRLEEQTDPFRTYPFSEQYADLRHWISVFRKV